jgi:hypothetical protein
MRDLTPIERFQRLDERFPENLYSRIAYRDGFVVWMRSVMVRVLILLYRMEQRTGGEAARGRLWGRACGHTEIGWRIEVAGGRCGFGRCFEMGKDIWILGNRFIMINECRLEEGGVQNGKLGG